MKFKGSDILQDAVTENKIKSLEKLKNEVLINYLSEINLDFEIDLYDKLIDYFVSGDLDSIYESENLKKYSKKEKKIILNDLHKFQNMCFYNKNKNYWLDSISMVSIEDYELIVYELFSNFQLLERIYLNSSIDALNLINNFDRESFFDNSLSIIENIKNSFIDEDTLVNVLKELSTNEDYKCFDTSKKLALIKFAEGTLYNVSNGKGIIKNSKEVLSKIKNDDNFYQNLEEEYFNYQEKIITFDEDYNKSK